MKEAFLPCFRHRRTLHTCVHISGFEDESVRQKKRYVISGNESVNYSTFVMKRILFLLLLLCPRFKWKVDVPELPNFRLQVSFLL